MTGKSVRRLDRACATWCLEDRTPANWPAVSPEGLTDEERREFDARKLALELFLSTNSPVAEILRRSGLTRSNLYRVVGRAYKELPDGTPAGWLSCLPYTHLKKYQRSAGAIGGNAGIRTLFFRTYPGLHARLDDLVLGRVKIHGAPVRGRHYSQVWWVFREDCKAAGLDVATCYPFTNRRNGKEWIRQYAEELRERHFGAAARTIHGDASGRLAVSANANLIPKKSLRPYDSVAIDGHMIDKLINVTIIDPLGQPIELTNVRATVLVALDIASRAVLGYSISLERNYSTDDALRCVEAIFAPWSAKELPPGLEYASGAGLPSTMVEGCARRAFDTLRMDNASSQITSAFQNRVIETGAIEVVSHRPAAPRSNTELERFFSTFEEAAFHQWPTTTGSGPNDPRRRDPEAAARRLIFTIPRLEAVVDVILANYNATPHTSLNGRTPLEYLEYRIKSGHDLVRRVSRTTRDGSRLFERDFPVTVRMNLEAGHRPYVQFHDQRYRSDTLDQRCDLDGQAATLRVDRRDIRSGELLVKGVSIGVLTMTSKWADVRHDLESRRAINAYRRDRKNDFQSAMPNIAASIAHVPRVSAMNESTGDTESGQSDVVTDTSSRSTRSPPEADCAEATEGQRDHFPWDVPGDDRPLPPPKRITSFST